jgi:hypothetical protein
LSEEECRREVDPLLLRVFRTVDLEKWPELARRAEQGRGFIIDGLETPFVEAVTQRAVFEAVPTLTEEQCRAICRAARNAGDAGLYCYTPVRTWRLARPAGQEYTEALREAAKVGTAEAIRAMHARFAEQMQPLPWWPARYFEITNDEEGEAFAAWFSDPEVMTRDSALISPSARWGVFITDNHHTVLGATADTPHFLADYCDALGTTPTEIAQEYVRGYEVSYWRRARRMGRASIYSWVPVLLAHLFGAAEATSLLVEPSDDDSGRPDEA